MTRLRAIVVAGAVGLVACGDDDESQTTAEQDLCASHEASRRAPDNIAGAVGDRQER
jgi:hypothetical protein